MKQNNNLFMFSGQGSQYYQMGADLFQHEPIFKKTMLDLDSQVKNILGLSIVDALYNQGRQKREPFDRTLLTSPAIFIVEYALAKTLLAKGICPAGVLGVSLGIFAAACVAGVMDPEETLAVIIKQARILEEETPKGKMIAILAAPACFEQHADIYMNAELAGINAANNFVISTTDEKLPLVLKTMDRMQFPYQVIAVSQAFHSRWIDSARTRCLELFNTVEYKASQMPIFCSAQQQEISDIKADHFWEIMRKPIQLANTYRFLESRGPFQYIDLGPSGTLATLLKYNLPPDSSSAMHTLLTPFSTDHKNYQRLLQNLAVAAL